MARSNPSRELLFREFFRAGVRILAPLAVGLLVIVAWRYPRVALLVVFSIAVTFGCAFLQSIWVVRRQRNGGKRPLPDVLRAAARRTLAMRRRPSQILGFGAVMSLSLILAYVLVGAVEPSGEGVADAAPIEETPTPTIELTPQPMDPPVQPPRSPPAPLPDGEELVPTPLPEIESTPTPGPPAGLPTPADEGAAPAAGEPAEGLVPTVVDFLVDEVGALLAPLVDSLLPPSSP